MNWSTFIRQAHRWTSIAFTLAVIVTTIVLAQENPVIWVSYVPLFPLALLLAASLARAETQTDPDGFTNPMQQLQFNPHLDQREFERSTLSALG